MDNEYKRSTEQLRNSFIAVFAYKGVAISESVQNTLESWGIETEITRINGWAINSFWDIFCETNWPEGPEKHLQDLSPDYLCILGYRGKLVFGDKNAPWGECLSLPYIRKAFGVCYLYDKSE